MLLQLSQVARKKVVQSTVAFAASTTLAYTCSTVYKSQPSRIPLPSFSSTFQNLGIPKAAAQDDEESLIYGGLSPARFKKFKLLSVDPVSPDSSIYYFGLEDPKARISLPVASYLLARAEVNMEGVVRPYTPLGSQIPGEIPLLVKTYPGGKMGNVFASMQPGDEIEFKGPILNYPYRPESFHRITLIAGGSGLTPMFQIMDHIINNPNDHTNMHLLYANKTQEDILIKPVLDDISSIFADQLKITYIIDQPEAGWKGPTGYITKELLLAVAGPPKQKDNHKIFVCGPPGMVEHIAGPKGPNYTQGELGGLLKDLGYSAVDVVKL